MKYRSIWVYGIWGTRYLFLPSAAAQLYAAMAYLVSTSRMLDCLWSADCQYRIVRGHADLAAAAFCELVESLHHLRLEHFPCCWGFSKELCSGVFFAENADEGCGVGLHPQGKRSIARGVLFLVVQPVQHIDHAELHAGCAEPVAHLLQAGLAVDLEAR